MFKAITDSWIQASQSSQRSCRSDWPWWVIVIWMHWSLDDPVDPQSPQPHTVALQFPFRFRSRRSTLGPQRDLGKWPGKGIRIDTLNDTKWFSSQSICWFQLTELFLHQVRLVASTEKAKGPLKFILRNCRPKKLLVKQLVISIDWNFYQIFNQQDINESLCTCEAHDIYARSWSIRVEPHALLMWISL